jgi:hypothetical protein
MSMYNDYEFFVEAVHPSGSIVYQSGNATSSRQFKMESRYAEEFALRMMGKFWSVDDKSPILPAPFPFDEYSDLPRNYGRVNLIATGFSIEPVSACGFNNNYVRDTGIANPTDLDTMEKYFKEHPDNNDDPWEDEDKDLANSELFSVVTINYEENFCDCVKFYPASGFVEDLRNTWEAHSDILPGTCISVERNPAYEMFTLPNAALIWKDLPSSTEQEEAARQLKADSYAYKIIPKADIIVSWHNVPVRNLCAIESHLKDFRGTVNDLQWGDVLFCDADPTKPTACGCGQYEPETIMFVDFQEDRARRTGAFGGQSDSTESNMNTTTLKLFFKQKRIERPTSESYSDSDDCPDDNDEAYGWNHLFLDRTAEEGGGQWSRVAIAGGDEDPLFPLKSFSDIMYPIL